MTLLSPYAISRCETNFVSPMAPKPAPEAGALPQIPAIRLIPLPRRSVARRRWSSVLLAIGVYSFLPRRSLARRRVDSWLISKSGAKSPHSVKERGSHGAFTLQSAFARNPCNPWLNLLQGAAKPISIGAPGSCVFAITALSGCTSMSLYVRLPSAVARGNSWSLRT